MSETTSVTTVLKIDDVMIVDSDIIEVADKLYGELADYEKEVVSREQYRYALRHWFEAQVKSMLEDTGWWLGRHYHEFKKGLEEAQAKEAAHWCKEQGAKITSVPTPDKQWPYSLVRVELPDGRVVEEPDIVVAVIKLKEQQQVQPQA
jgi:hypothetical protein